MPDVLIRGIELPKEGVYTCELSVLDESTALLTIYTPIDKPQRSYKFVFLPEGHGKLGDLDALINELHNLLDKREKDAAFSGDREAGVTWDDAINNIIAAPIIIPAEGGGAQ